MNVIVAASRQSPCQQGNEYAAISKPRLINVLVQVPPQERIMRDVMIELAVIAIAVRKSVNRFGRQFGRKALQGARAEESRPVAAIIRPDGRALPEQHARRCQQRPEEGPHRGPLLRRSSGFASYARNE